jgi:serine/threonine-protein kinase TNNI3K
LLSNLRELFSGKFVFEDSSLQFIIKAVVEDKVRPKIPDSFHPQLAELIKNCWATNPQSRPDYTQILEALSKLSSDYT